MGGAGGGCFVRRFRCLLIRRLWAWLPSSPRVSNGLGSGGSGVLPPGPRGSLRSDDLADDPRSGVLPPGDFDAGESLSEEALLELTLIGMTSRAESPESLSSNCNRVQRAPTAAPSWSWPQECDEGGATAERRQRWPALRIRLRQGQRVADNRANTEFMSINPLPLR